MAVWPNVVMLEGSGPTKVCLCTIALTLTKPPCLQHFIINDKKLMTVPTYAALITVNQSRKAANRPLGQWNFSNKKTVLSS